MEIKDELLNQTTKLQKLLEKLYQHSAMTGRILLVALKKFISDEILIRTSAISYAVVVSFVPTVIAILMFGAALLDLDMVFDTLHSQATRLGLDIDLNNYKDPIRDFISSAAKVIGGIGILITLWSATNVFRNLEAALNVVWKVTNSRSLIVKVAQFGAALILGLPILLISLNMTNKLVDSFRSPDYQHLFKNGTYWYIQTSKNYLMQASESDLKKGKLAEFKNIADWDLLSQQDQWLWNQNKNRPASKAEIQNSDQSAIEKATMKSGQLRGMFNLDKWKWYVYNNGVIAREKLGKTRMRQFGMISMRSEDGVVSKYNNKVLQFSRVFQKGDTVFITAQDGLVLVKVPKQDNWYLTSTNENKRKIFDIQTGLGNRVWVCGENELLASFNPATRTWTPANQKEKAAKIGSHFSFNRISMYKNTMYLPASNSRIYSMNPNGVLEMIEIVPLHVERINISDFHRFTNKKMVAYAQDGFFRASDDGGQTWQEVSLDSKRGKPTHVAGYQIDDSGSFIVLGNHGQLHQLKFDGNKPVLKTLASENKMISFLGKTFNFIITFFVIWLMFFTINTWLPYTKVRFLPAAIGAGFTSIVWVGFIFFFSYYVNNLAGKTMAIYGALAAIPLGLLLVYSSMAIILLGAELAYVVQHPMYYIAPRAERELELETNYLWYGFHVIILIHGDHIKGVSPTSHDDLLKACNFDGDELEGLLKRFKDKGWILENSEDHSYLPMCATENILLVDILETIYDQSNEILNYDDKNAVMKNLKQLIDTISASYSKALKDQDLHQFIKKIQKEQC